MSKLGKGTTTTDEAIIELKVAADGVAEATILKMLKDEPERIFEYIKETKDAGDYFICKTVDDVEVKIAKSELSAEAKVCLKTGCFTGETLIKTSTGLRRIDSLNEGDLVLSKDIKTGVEDYNIYL